ncbi:MAG TPA: hypothetical protein VFS23_02785, partial [Vicinamibacterales bacterium]|nr:hypothetical protein [Vicinamibacterales bacterium]
MCERRVWAHAFGRAGVKRPVLAVLACACLLLARAAAAETTSPTAKTCDVGVYIISLQDFDFARGTFGADFWVWSTCPSKELRPLDVMDFTNSVRIDTRLPSTFQRGDVFWSYLKVSGVFRHHWNVRRYPFDGHVLRIEIENTNAPASEFAYRADRAASQPSRDIVLDGWRITRFDIQEATYVYDTNFGDPAFAGKKQSDYSRLQVGVAIERTKRWSFVTLVAGVHVAFALSAIAFLLGPYNGRRRANLLAGTLFAVVVNQRVAESVIGRTEQITLLDEIHLV